MAYSWELDLPLVNEASVIYRQSLYLNPEERGTKRLFSSHRR